MKQRLREFLVILGLVLACWPRLAEVTAQVAATRFIPRHGTTAEHALFAGLTGELTVDTTKHTVVIGETGIPGGHPLATEQSVTDHLADLANPHAVTAAQAGALATGATAGGDVSGTFGALAVEQVQGVPVAASAPTADQVLAYDGAAWSPVTLTPSGIGAANDGVNSDLTDLQTLATAKWVGGTTGSVTVQAPTNGADWTLTLPADDGGTGYGLVTDGSGVTSWSASAGGGDNVSVDGAGVVDPDLVSTGDVDVVNTANALTFNLNADVVGTAEMADADHGDVTWSGGVATVQGAASDAMGPTQIAEASDYTFTGKLVDLGTDAPATCTAGALFIDTNGNTTGTTCDAASNSRPKWCACTATNTWKGTDLGT